MVLRFFTFAIFASVTLGCTSTDWNTNPNPHAEEREAPKSNSGGGSGSNLQGTGGQSSSGGGGNPSSDNGEGSYTENKISDYRTVKIGNQTWMAENLNYAAEGSKCYDNKPENCRKYGRLYIWTVAKTACPSGWHLPSKAEWGCAGKLH